MRKLILLLITLLSFSSCMDYSGWIIERKYRNFFDGGGTFVISHPQDMTIISRLRVEEYTFNLYNIGDTIR